MLIKRTDVRACCAATKHGKFFTDCQEQLQVAVLGGVPAAFPREGSCPSGGQGGAVRRAQDLSSCEWVTWQEEATPVSKQRSS